ncbi:MAG: bifunctional 3-deoxy-7-phosphoheptulonate synthase/chorismate mutase type II [Bacteroidales bacterium]|nr:bifunctional 3-deoxy-7-phosphoheptulonate synthase/chorismate mutase type II [Bacteroidales bacterium]
MSILRIQEWFDDIGDRPVMIAGPCSAESDEQIQKTADALSGPCKPSFFRAGIWKPRTRPGTFSGVGTKGLQWMIKVKERTGMRLTVEAASPRHVEACLKAGIDVIWLGARTVSNPFSVQEIAEALKGVDIPVLVKNPLNPDIDLWLGAIERINNAGISKVAAVHRGFSPFERTRYRNMPKWEIAIELRRRLKEISVLCDPSHIGGDVVMVPELAQKAMDLNMDGLMLEVHHDPLSALSDNKQQLLPENYCRLIENLVIRCPKPEDPGFINQLDELRSQIDSVDHQLIELLSRRLEIIDMIGHYKYSNNAAILQMDRWVEILNTRLEQAGLLGLDRDFTERYLKLMHQESIRRQTDIMKKMEEKQGKSADKGPDN